jgi:hypothetical protein
MLTLSPILPNAAIGVTRIIALLHTAGGKDDVPLGASIQAVVSLEGADSALGEQPNLSLLGLVERWWWSESVMGTLSQFQSYVGF